MPLLPHILDGVQRLRLVEMVKQQIIVPAVLSRHRNNRSRSHLNSDASIGEERSSYQAPHIGRVIRVDK